MAGIAIVIGGTRRVGRWVSEALLVEGYQVHAIYRQDSGAAEKLATNMRAAGYQLHAHKVDARNPKMIKDLIQAIAEAAGGIDVLINCSGPALEGGLLATSPEELTDLYGGNLLTVHNAVQAAAPYLHDGEGRIINFLSISTDTQRAFRSFPAYASMKAALSSYTRSLARELAHTGISVNAIALGVTSLDADGAPDVETAKLPMGRAVGQEDVAAAVWYLVGPGAEQATGSVLNLSGGFGL